MPTRSSRYTRSARIAQHTSRTHRSTPRTRESGAGEAQLPFLRAVAEVGDGEVTGLFRFELGNQGKRIVVRHQVEAEPRRDGTEGPEDRGVADGVRDGAGVQHDLGLILVPAGATAGSSGGGSGGVQFNRFNSHILTIDLS